MDILGFIVWVVGFMVLPVRDIASRVGEQLRQTTDEYLLRLGAGVKSWMVRLFLKFSFAVALAEIAWAIAVFNLGGWHGWRSWIFFLALTIGNIGLALWNEFHGRVEGNGTGEDRIAVMSWRFMKLRFDAWRQATGGSGTIYQYTARSKPLAWWFLVPVLFMAQGLDLQVNALYVPNFSFLSFLSPDEYTWHQRQLLEIFSLISCSMGGSFLVASGYFLKYTIRRGVRLLEWATTKATQLALAIPPGIEYRDTLKELGGQIDLINEDFVGSAADFFLSVWFTVALPLCLASIFVPWYPLWFVTVLAMIASGISTYLYFRTGEAAHADINHESRVTRKLVFKLSIIGTVLLEAVEIVIMVWKEDILNAWYGVTFYAYNPWWTYLLLGLGSAAFVPFFWKIHKMIKASIQEGAWVNKAKEFGSAAFIVLSGLAVVVGVVSFVCMVQDIRGRFQDTRRINSARFDAMQIPGAVSYSKPPEVAISGGEYRLSFVTERPAQGVLEFLRPQEAMAAGLPPYLVIGPELNDPGNCGKTRDQSCDSYRHTVAFDAGRYSGPFRIIMRNADERDRRLFGKVETLDPQKAEKPAEPSKSKPTKNQDRTSDDVEDPPVRSAPSRAQASRVAAKPCPTLESIPGFR